MSNWLDHKSFLGHLGSYGDKYLNPISWITGGKSTKLTSEVLPEKVNSGLSHVMQPFDKVDQTINPVRKIPIVNRAANITKAKPGDAAAIAAGAVFGGGALMGGGGAGAAGGGAVAGGGGAAAGGGAAGAADVGGLAALDSGAVASEGAASGLMAGGEGGLVGGGAVATGGAEGSLVGGGAAGGGSTADVAGLQAADSAAVDAEGAEPGLTQGYGPADSSSASTQQYRPQQQQRKRQQQAQPYSPINGLSEDQYQSLVNQATNQIAQSSKTVKTRGATQAAMQRGLAGAHPVDTNGVHIAAIQELNKQIEDLGARIKAAKAKRAAKGASA